MKLQYSILLKCFSFLCVCMVCLSNCASKSDIQTQEPVKQEIQQSPQEDTAASGIQQPVLDSIRVVDEQNISKVVIATTVPPNYTIFKLSKPDRLIIDLLDVVLGNNKESQEIQNDFISRIRSVQIKDKEKNFLRIEILIKKDIIYNAITKNNTVVIDIKDRDIKAASDSVKSETSQNSIDKKEKQRGTSTGKPAKSIEDVKVISSDAGYEIMISADGDIKKYKAYTLQNPYRLVIDLPAVTSQNIKPVTSVESEFIENIRVGQNNSNSRVVIDLKGNKLPYYHVAQEENQINISISKDEPQKQEQKVEDKAKEDLTAENINKELKSDETTVTIPAENKGIKEYTGEKISFDFKDADIKNVLRLIADISGMNIIVGDRVSGKVTLKIENIAWDEALDIILENNGLGKIESKNIVRIDTSEQIKRINEEKLLAKKSQEQVEDTIVKTIDISYAKASDIASFIKNMNILTQNRGSVTSFELTNKLTVNDIPSVVSKIENIIKEQDIPTRQVMIEARVIQTSPNYVKEMGIQWGGEYMGHQSGGKDQGGADIPISGTLGADGTSVVDLLTSGNIGLGFGYIKDKYNLNVKISALENEDKLKILSNPKILSLDNKESEIKQGVALPYLKLNENGVSTTEFKEAVLEMKVRPKITAANTIALKIEVKKDQKSAQTGVNNEPGIDVREIKTDLLVASGKTVVIGGIYENTVAKNVKKVPFFADIPYLGRAFRSEYNEDTLTELLVFLTVTVVESPETVADANEKQG